MSLMANPPAPAKGGAAGGEQPKPFIRKENVKVAYAKPSLETKEDVEEYIKELKEQYLKIIAENKRISL